MFSTLFNHNNAPTQPCAHAARMLCEDTGAPELRQAVNGYRHPARKKRQAPPPCKRGEQAFPARAFREAK